jgi:hypothetical protein
MALYELEKDAIVAVAPTAFGLEHAAVLWLNESGLDLRCVRVKPYSLDGRALVHVQQINPLPEAAEYTVRVSRIEHSIPRAISARRKN